MKRRLTAIIALAGAACAFGQGYPQQWAGAGLGWNQYAAPQINGLAAYARQLAGGEHPTYSFTLLNVASVSMRPFRVMTSEETGIAQHALRFGRFDVYGLGTAGISQAGAADGSSAGFVFGGGGLAMAPIGRGWTAGPYVRVFKSALADRQWQIGLLVGWGK